jgi:hypothetical protein
VGAFYLLNFSLGIIFCDKVIAKTCGSGGIYGGKFDLGGDGKGAVSHPKKRRRMAAGRPGV